RASGDKGTPPLRGRRAAPPARRPPPQVLRSQACRRGRAPPGVPDFYRDDRRARSAAGDEMSVRPPRLAVWLLTRRVSAEWREFVLGDLEEEFLKRGSASPSGARR